MTAIAFATPRRLLLASDLSCRCDRALDRAVGLASAWDAELVVAHVVAPDASQADLDPDAPSWRRAGSPVETALARLRADLGEPLKDVRVIVEEGDPARDLARIARREACDLIVAGAARGETFGDVLLGTTVHRLADSAHCPILTVRRRPRTPYRDVVVATDFSDASRRGLAAAAAFFPDAALTLLHGYDAPFGLFFDRSNLREDLRRMEAEIGAAFLEDTPLDPAVRRNVRVLVEHGDPVRLVADYAGAGNADLTVIAAQGRNALLDLVIGGTARRLLDVVPGDVLLVRPPEPKA